MSIPKVIDIVVNNNLCIGCGTCVYVCPSNAIEMKWDDYGFLIPTQLSSCDSDNTCLQVCPFNPFPEKEVETEDELAEFFLENTINKHTKIGKYNKIYAGFSKEYRLTSSSGGLATYIFTQLLKRGVVNHILSVKESSNTNFKYEYAISSHKKEIELASKTKYYPVSLSGVLKELNNLEGKVAIVGVACFIKSIRLVQHKQPILKEKIAFLVGIICGGIKSKFFTEYLAEKAGVKYNEYLKPEFRVKDFNSKASDYSFECNKTGNNRKYTIKMKNVGDMWGTGLFKANACDFCDDVTTELSDISLGDAWLNPFINDGKGTNVVVTRSPLADIIIEEGIESGELYVKELPLDKFLNSQKGSYNHRHIGLHTRIQKTLRDGKIVPPKRFGKQRSSLDFRLVQLIRMKVRRKSLVTWKETTNSLFFDKKMKNSLKKLQKATQIYHYKKAFIDRFKIFIKRYFFY